MLVTIQEVQVQAAPNGKNYEVAEVNYLREGKPETRKIVSFSNPDVFKTLSNLTEFPVDVNVVLRKDGSFWNWVKIEIAGKETNNAKKEEVAAPEASRPSQRSATQSAPFRQGRVTGSNYETPEERARRQVYIIRQSSITSAIAFLAARNPKGFDVPVEEVLKLASQFENFVMTPRVEDTPL